MAKPRRRVRADPLRQDRDRAIREAYTEGLTLAAIGRQHNLTDARIWQIVNRYKGKRSHGR